MRSLTALDAIFDVCLSTNVPASNVPASNVPALRPVIDILKKSAREPSHEESSHCGGGSKENSPMDEEPFSVRLVHFLARCHKDSIRIFCEHSFSKKEASRVIDRIKRYVRLDPSSTGLSESDQNNLQRRLKKQKKAFEKIGPLMNLYAMLMALSIMEKPFLTDEHYNPLCAQMLTLLMAKVPSEDWSAVIFVVKKRVADQLILPLLEKSSIDGTCFFSSLIFYASLISPVPLIDTVDWRGEITKVFDKDPSKGIQSAIACLQLLESYHETGGDQAALASAFGMLVLLFCRVDKPIALASAMSQDRIFFQDFNSMECLRRIDITSIRFQLCLKSGYFLRRYRTIFPEVPHSLSDGDFTKEYFENCWLAIKNVYPRDKIYVMFRVIEAEVKKHLLAYLVAEGKKAFEKEPCTIYFEPMETPVTCNGKQWYEKKTIEQWLCTSTKDPYTQNHVTIKSYVTYEMIVSECDGDGDARANFLMRNLSGDCDSLLNHALTQLFPTAPASFLDNLRRGGLRFETLQTFMLPTPFEQLISYVEMKPRSPGYDLIRSCLHWVACNPAALHKSALTRSSVFAVRDNPHSAACHDQEGGIMFERVLKK